MVRPRRPGSRRRHHRGEAALKHVATTLGSAVALLAAATSSHAQVPPGFWDRFALRDEGPVVLSVKYADPATRSRLLRASLGGADLPFVARVVVRMTRDQAMTFEGDAGVRDVEVFGAHTADRTFHKLLELYRVYLYQVSGRFDVSVVNFSQGVAYWDRSSSERNGDAASDGGGERGERTISEALDVVASRVAPVLVAVGDGREFGVGAWAMAPAAIPVVATTARGAAVLAESALPERGRAPWRTVLYADGEPTPGLDAAAGDATCGEGAHLTADQMLHPEEARVPPPGGSSYATFKATHAICYIQQFSEVLRVQLRARTPVGSVEVEPFVAYYVDSPVNKACPATKNRWADQRFQVEPPRYEVEATDKARLDGLVNGNAMELRATYSIPLLKAFLNHLPPHPVTSAVPNERYVSSHEVLEMLRDFRMRDLVEVAGNTRNVRFEDWLRKADQDPRPVLSAKLVDEIADYCGSRTSFLVLSDEAPSFLESLP